MANKTESPRPMRSDEYAGRRLAAGDRAKVPAELRELEIVEPMPWKVNVVDRPPASSAVPEPTKPHRPAWVEEARKPRRAVVGRGAKRKLWHYGAELDPLFIWGADDRRAYNDRRYPWVCVCRVLTPVNTGSGVLVGPRHVLTASHLIDWSGGGGSVEVHRAGGAVAGMSPITAVWYYTKLTGSAGGWSDVDEDYAVIVLRDRLGDRFGWFGTRTYDSGWDDEPYWWNIGYPGDVAGGTFPIFQRGQRMDEDEWDWGSARAMTTTADVMSGQSGSPMFGFWDDGPYVVAVASATGWVFLSGDENWCSGGSDLTRLVLGAIAGDP